MTNPKIIPEIFFQIKNKTKTKFLKETKTKTITYQ
jgi:hypothetical protein